MLAGPAVLTCNKASPVSVFASPASGSDAGLPQVLLVFMTEAVITPATSLRGTVLAHSDHDVHSRLAKPHSRLK